MKELTGVVNRYNSPPSLVERGRGRGEWGLFRLSIMFFWLFFLFLFRETPLLLFKILEAGTQSLLLPVKSMSRNRKRAQLILIVRIESFDITD
jgi:hypothetical protein